MAVPIQSLICGLSRSNTNRSLRSPKAAPFILAKAVEDHCLTRSSSPGLPGIGAFGRLIEALTGGTALVESRHGAGSPQAQRVMILREGDLEKKVKLTKALAGSRPLGLRKLRPALKKEGKTIR